MNRQTLMPVLMLALLLPLAACNQSDPAATTAAEASTTASAGAASDAPSAAAQAAAASAAADAGAVSETAAGPAPADASAGQPAPVADASMAAAGDGAGLVEGKDYVTIEGGKPYEPLNGKIEVVEVFGYVCPACARFEPMVTAWEKKLPPDVRFTYVPAPFGPQWIPYAKAFYVADAQGLVDKTHTALFHAIHLEQSLPGEGKTPDPDAVAAFYGKYGANPAQFLEAMESFATAGKVKRGMQFMIRSGVQGTPTMVVDGKYRVLGKSYEDMLVITDKLIARERAASGTAAR